ncbi:Transcriptional regulator [Moraxella catarrhalis]|uniref:Transcriptional regulator n=1 Tax=Moraxella catarrhalis TaxID=480 RepID=A0A198UHJ9_MORCA|nr:Transcriptional regulator [Moraxella catarrhalis]OAU94702.1 Transcriptional regulator [Moraxella catarrhalis]OAV03083.1 Transcriptional regulator [Moraxella catarrhalis]
MADGTAQACHVPVLAERRDDGIWLFTRVDRANLIWLYFETPWLLPFVGASHYISANWYPSKALTRKEVPTYHYQAIHIRATPSIVTDLDAIRILAKIIDCFENHLHNINPEHTPWRLTDAPGGFIYQVYSSDVPSIGGAAESHYNITT